jgi:hypothetical protein
VLFDARSSDVPGHGVAGLRSAICSWVCDRKEAGGINVASGANQVDGRENREEHSDHFFVVEPHVPHRLHRGKEPCEKRLSADDCGSLPGAEEVVSQNAVGLLGLHEYK